MKLKKFETLLLVLVASAVAFVSAQLIVHSNNPETSEAVESNTETTAEPIEYFVWTETNETPETVETTAQTSEVTTFSVETENTDTIFNDDNSTLNDSVTDCHRLYLGNFRITGYTDEEGFYYGKKTAYGDSCREGIIAMNSGRIKELGLWYGATIYIDGLGTYTLADAGCSYNTVDVWVWTNSEASTLTGYRDVYLVR